MKRLQKHNERLNYRVTLTLNNDQKNAKAVSKKTTEQPKLPKTLDKRGRKKHNLDELAQRTQNTILKLVQKIKNTTDLKERKRLSNLISAY